MGKRSLYVLVASLLMLLFAGCGNSMKDGYYTAEMAEFSHGWKEYLCIQVKGNHIVSAEFNAKNETGFIKAWDNNYMKNMSAVNTIYPNKYTREYVAQLIEKQNLEGIETISGATNSGDNFKKLVAAVLEQAKAGDSKVKIVE